MQRLWVLHAVKIRKGNSRSRSPTHLPVPNIQSMPYAKHSKSPNERVVRRRGDLNRTSGRNSGLFPIRNRYQTDSEERDQSSALAYYTGSKNDPVEQSCTTQREKTACNTPLLQHQEWSRCSLPRSVPRGRGCIVGTIVPIMPPLSN